MSPEQSARMLRLLNRLLFAIGFACLAWYAGMWTFSAVYQQKQRAMLAQTLSARALPGDAHAKGQILPAGPKGLIGQLVIPRLSLSAVVLEGDDDLTLAAAVGHLPDTPLPWQAGNSAVAAHRDTLFRGLKDIRVGDEVALTTLHGDLTYRVRDVDRQSRRRVGPRPHRGRNPHADHLLPVCLRRARPPPVYRAGGSNCSGWAAGTGVYSGSASKLTDHPLAA